MVENGHTECLTLGVSPEIGLETEGVDSRNERLDGVQGRSGYRGILKKIKQRQAQSGNGHIPHHYHLVSTKLLSMVLKTVAA